MAIYGLLSQASFAPDAVEVMAEAYECALVKLRLKDRLDPITELVALKIIALYALGEREPLAMCERALSELSGKRI